MSTQKLPVENRFVELGFPPMQEFFDTDARIRYNAMLHAAFDEIERLRAELEKK